MASTQYITKDGDRWDLIAVSAYGVCNGDKMRILQNANPYIPRTDVFAAGIKIVIPIIEAENEEITELLPPWKR